jgi:uncharacterized protein (TIGR00255 family)
MKPRPAPESVKSMTGYAQARMERDGWVLRVSVRSVNHRFLDLRVRLPEGLEGFEAEVRQLVRDRLRRGHVEVALHAETADGPSVQVNRQVAEAYLHAVEQLRDELGLREEPDLVALLRLPGVVAATGSSGAALDEAEIGRLRGHVTECVAEALSRLEEMRRAEGQALGEEMNRLAAGIGRKVAEVEALVEQNRPAYAQHLKTRVEELLKGGPIDPARLAQEAAVLAERADVSEEMARLRSHVEQFRDLVAGAGEIGKRLDFLLQEMQREANTLLSKTPGLGEDGLAMTECGLEIKAEIEKLREQVQNVE